MTKLSTNCGQKNLFCQGPGNNIALRKQDIQLEMSFPSNKWELLLR